MKRRFFDISAFFFFFFALIGVYVIFLPKILQNFHYTSVQIGIIFSIAPLMRFITPFFFLRHFKLNKNVFYHALVAMLLTILLFYTTVEHFLFFAITNVIYGIASGLILPYVETYALKTLQKEHYGKARLYGSIGFIFVALLLAKLLHDNYIGMHFIAVTILMSVWFAFRIAQNNHDFTDEKHQADAHFHFGKTIPLWISIFLMQVSFGAFYSFFTIYESEHHLSLPTISYLWTFGVICEIVLFYYQSHLLRFPLLRLIRLTLFVTIFRWLLLFWFPDNIWIVFFSQSIHALSFALYHSATLSYLSAYYHNHKLAAQFYYGFGFGLGGFAGSLIAGYSYGPYLFLVSASIALLAFIAALFYTPPKELKA